jgi:hypothetical protein
LSKGPEDLPIYEDEYDAIQEEFKNLKPIFDSRIPQMLKIADEFSVNGDPLLHSNRLYFNTFFWINKHLVPSSWILE